MREQESQPFVVHLEVGFVCKICKKDNPSYALDLSVLKRTFVVAS